MKTVLNYEVTNMQISHNEDVTLHIVLTIHHSQSQSTLVESESHLVDSYTIQEETPRVEIQYPVVSSVARVQHEHLERVKQTSESLQESISLRERDVLERVAQGMSNQEIAQVLVLSVDTVKRHLSNIFSKLHVRNRMQAVVQARLLGMLVEPGDSSILPFTRPTLKSSAAVQRHDGGSRDATG